MDPTSYIESSTSEIFQPVSLNKVSNKNLSLHRLLLREKNKKKIIIFLKISHKMYFFFLNFFYFDFYQLICSISWPLAGSGRCKFLQVDWLSPIHGPYATALKGLLRKVEARGLVFEY